MLAADFVLSEIKIQSASYLPSKKNKAVVMVCFNAPMGAGKTTLITAICKQLGVIDTPASPTFSIINEYATVDHKKIIHIDLYRINDVEDLLQVGFEEVIENCDYCFIEWSQIAKDLLPAEYNTVEIKMIDETMRELVIS